jgi:hypothetical protein
MRLHWCALCRAEFDYNIQASSLYVAEVVTFIALYTVRLHIFSNHFVLKHISSTIVQQRSHSKIPDSYTPLKIIERSPVSPPTVRHSLLTSSLPALRHDPYRHLRLARTLLVRILVDLYRRGPTFRFRHQLSAAFG